MTFGEFLKEKRLSTGLSLRKFCEIAGLDASNWSKVERGLIPLTLETAELRRLAKIVKLSENTPEWIKFFDLAAIAKKKIPEYVFQDQDVLDALPVFFRTAGKQKPSDEELEKLIQLLKRR